MPRGFCSGSRGGMQQEWEMGDRCQPFGRGPQRVVWLPQCTLPLSTIKTLWVSMAVVLIYPNAPIMAVVFKESGSYTQVVTQQVVPAAPFQPDP